jgi:hypothetical protein
MVKALSGSKIQYRPVKSTKSQKGNKRAQMLVTSPPLKPKPKPLF